MADKGTALTRRSRPAHRAVSRSESNKSHSGRNREPARLLYRDLGQCRSQRRYRHPKGLIGTPDQDVVAAATAAGRILVLSVHGGHVRCGVRDWP
jgi:hypothetical protein